MRAVLDRAEFSLERWLTEVWKMALADNTVVFDRDGNLKPFDEWPIESRRGLQGLDAEEIYGQVDGERQRVGVLRKPRFVPKPPWFEMLGKFYNVLNRNAERAGENGGSTVTILQLLQQAILPEGTTRQRIEAEAVEVVATPVEDARETALEPPGAQRTGGADMTGGSKTAGQADSGGNSASPVDNALVGLAGGVFGNGNGKGNGKPD
jgi:hypothetical protein